jgi:CheY-like chemotaxis protein
MALEILLVEDNEGDVVAVQRAFRSEQPVCNISVANDGAEALDFVFRRGNFTNAPLPQLILLDLNLPRMDGKQFLEVFKKQEELRAIPVIMLTSSESPKDIRECYERHASCYVVKPFSYKELSEKVREIINFWSLTGRVVQN